MIQRILRNPNTIRYAALVAACIPFAYFVLFYLTL
jgi:hypothetical protein